MRTLFTDIAGFSDHAVRESGIFAVSIDADLEIPLTQETDTPEHELMRQLLTFTLNEALGIHGTQWKTNKISRLSKSELPDPTGAYWWIMGPSEHTETGFSFNEVCFALRLDPKIIRKLLQKRLPNGPSSLTFRPKSCWVPDVALPDGTLHAFEPTSEAA